MGSYREQSEKAKAARREPAPEPAKFAAAKKPKKPDTHGVFRVWTKDDSLKTLKRFFNPSKPWAKFPSKEAAEAWIEKRARSHSFIPKNSERNMQDVLAKERQRWTVKEL